jgi:hypothetical protein
MWLTVFREQAGRWPAHLLGAWQEVAHPAAQLLQQAASCRPPRRCCPHVNNSLQVSGVCLLPPCCCKAGTGGGQSQCQEAAVKLEAMGCSAIEVGTVEQSAAAQ